jgi:hypothetical protein
MLSEKQNQSLFIDDSALAKTQRDPEVLRCALDIAILDYRPGKGRDPKQGLFIEVWLQALKGCKHVFGDFNSFFVNLMIEIRTIREGSDRR